MTKENGKIQVTLTIPALGQVMGAKTLGEVVDGTAAAEKEGEAVIVKPLKK